MAAAAVVPGPVLPGADLSRTAGRNLGARDPRVLSLRGSVRVCGSPSGSLALSVFVCLSLCVSVSPSLRQSAGLRHLWVCISPLTSLCEFLFLSLQVIFSYGFLCVSPLASIFVLVSDSIDLSQ